MTKLFVVQSLGPEGCRIEGPNARRHAWAVCPAAAGSSDQAARAWTPKGRSGPAMPHKTEEMCISSIGAGLDQSSPTFHSVRSGARALAA